MVLTDKLRELAQPVIQDCVERIEQGVREGVFVMQPPTEEEHKNYYLGKLNAYFELWASTWSMKTPRELQSW